MSEKSSRLNDEKGVALVIAPGRPQLRLVPVEPSRARWLAAATIAIASRGTIGNKYLNCWLENSQNRNIIAAIPAPIFASTGRSNFQSAQMRIGNPIKNATPKTPSKYRASSG